MRKKVRNDEEHAIFLENARSWKKERINWDEVEAEKRNKDRERRKKKGRGTRRKEKIKERRNKLKKVEAIRIFILPHPLPRRIPHHLRDTNRRKPRRGRRRSLEILDKEQKEIASSGRDKNILFHPSMRNSPPFLLPFFSRERREEGGRDGERAGEKQTMRGIRRVRKEGEKKERRREKRG